MSIGQLSLSGMAERDMVCRVIFVCQVDVEVWLKMGYRGIEAVQSELPTTAMESLGCGSSLSSTILNPAR